MKVKVILVLLIIFTLFSSVPVFAEEQYLDSNTGISCSGALLGTTQKVKPRGSKYYYPAYYLQVVFDIMKYIGIAACIVLSIVDFVEVILSDGNDDCKKAINKTIKRLAFAAAIFFLPIIVMQILKVVGVVALGTFGIS